MTAVAHTVIGLIGLVIGTSRWSSGEDASDKSQRDVMFIAASLMKFT